MSALGDRVVIAAGVAGLLGLAGVSWFAILHAIGRVDSAGRFHAGRAR